MDIPNKVYKRVEIKVNTIDKAKNNFSFIISRKKEIRKFSLNPIR